MEDGRDVALELRRLVDGDLRGMFDGPTTPGLRLDGPLVVLDLSAVYHSPALGVLMACAAAWLQSAVRAQHRNRTIVVVDEAWAILSNLGIARWLQTSWKMSRAFGVANVAVLHRLSDLPLGGTAGVRAGQPGRRAVGRLGDPGGLRSASVGGGATRRAARFDSRPKPSWSPSCGGEWRCGRWAAGRSWSSIACPLGSSG